MGNKLEKIYLRLCLTSVFSKVLEKPLFQAFFGYMQTDRLDEASLRKGYAKFVSEIYLGGGSLTALTERLLAEDENVYIKSVAKGRKPDPNVERSAQAELDSFEAFSILTVGDFALDMGISENDGNVIFPEGNALKYLAEYFSDEHPDNPYLEDPRDMRCVSFEPNGNVLGGNVYECDIMEIIKDYAP